MSDAASSSRYCNSLPGLNRLLEVTRLLAAEIDTAHALDTITAEAVKALHCDRAVLYQFDAKRNVLFATAGTEHELIVPLDRGLAGYVARQRELVNIADARRDSRWHAAHDQLDGYQTQTVLAVPLVAARDGRLLGVLEMLNNVGGPFDSDDESLASHSASMPRRRSTGPVCSAKSTSAASWMPRSTSPARCSGASCPAKCRRSTATTSPRGGFPTRRSAATTAT